MKKKEEMTEEEKAQDRFRMKAEEMTITFIPTCLNCNEKVFNCKCSKDDRKLTTNKD